MNHMFERSKHKEEPAAETTPEKGLTPEGKIEVTPEVVQERVEKQRNLLQRAWEKIKGGGAEEGEKGEEPVEAKEESKERSDLKKKLVLYGVAAFIGANAVMGAMPSSNAEAGGRHHDRGGETIVINPVGLAIGALIGWGARGAAEQRRQEQRPPVIIVQQQERQGRQERMDPELKTVLRGLGKQKATEDYRPGRNMDASGVEGYIERYIPESVANNPAAKEQAVLAAVGAYVERYIQMDQQAKGR